MKVRLYFAVVGLPERMQMAFDNHKTFLKGIAENGIEYYAIFGDDLEQYNLLNQHFQTIAFPNRKAWMEFENTLEIVNL